MLYKLYALCLVNNTWHGGGVCCSGEFKFDGIAIDTLIVEAEEILFPQFEKAKIVITQDSRRVYYITLRIPKLEHRPNLLKLVRSN